MAPELKEYFKKMKNKVKISYSEKQNEIDMLTLNFVVNGMRPLSIVEDKDFLQLCYGKNITRCSLLCS